MKKLLAGLFVSLVALVLWSGLSQAGTYLGPVWKEFSPGLSRTGGTVRDTMTLLSADTLRTGNINTDDWDWMLNNSVPASATPMILATVTFQTVGAQVAANIVGDSLYFDIERGFPNGDGTITYCPSTYQPAVPLGTYAGAIGNCAIANVPFGAGDAGAHTWVGSFVFDRDATLLSPVPHNNLWGLRNFRLLVHGDISSTAQALGGLRCVITYPSPHFISQ
jgi:hypothetical protein